MKKILLLAPLTFSLFSCNRPAYVQSEAVQLRAASIKLEVENLAAIPSWHPGAGSTPWLFVDEVLLR